MLWAKGMVEPVGEGGASGVAAAASQAGPGRLGLTRANTVTCMPGPHQG